ncbi:MAG: diacylglycerol kinase family protein [Proteobacteria bacterium]|nr:diacylglycerol kinase family protein [Pseudomonadota bacterium]
MAGIGIISNPHSKLNRQNPKRSDYLSYIAGKEGHVAITKSMAELSDVAKTFKEQDISILAINGGDGTISQTLSIFYQVYQDKTLPKIALLRGGTMNVLANNLNIKGTPEQILYRLIEKHSTGAPITVVTQASLKIDNKIGFLFASGTPVNFLQRFYQHDKSSLMAVWLILKVVLFRFCRKEFYKKIVTTTSCQITVDEETSVEHNTISIFISTLAHMPLGPKLFPDMEPQLNTKQNKAQLVSYTIDPLKASVRVPWDAFLLAAKDTNIKTRLLGQKFTLTTESKMPYTLDGELYSQEDQVLNISLGPAFEFLILS